LAIDDDPSRAVEETSVGPAPDGEGEYDHVSLDESDIGAAELSGNPELAAESESAAMPPVEPRTLRPIWDTDYLPAHGGGIFTTTVNQLVGWGRANSLWPALFGLACCAIEMMATSASRWDLARFGAEVFRASPRQSDLMIVAGRVSVKMAPVIRQIYDQMPDPKWVIAMGACASTGGVFNNYAVVQGVDQVVPVDVYVPGCPPSPDMLMYGFTMLQDKIRKGIPPASDMAMSTRGTA
jgi:NADH-quinone oxidoreductase subunit B